MDLDQALTQVEDAPSQNPALETALSQEGSSLDAALSSMPEDFGTGYEEQETIDAVKNALPKTLKVANPLGEDFDTGIELSEDIAAYLTSTGHMMSEVVRGVEQLAGRDIEREKQNEKAMNALYSDERYRTAALAGAVTGAIAEPAGFVLLSPVVKANNLWKVAQVGAMTGAAYGALSYADEEHGLSRLQQTMVGMVSGGILSPTVVGAFKAVDSMGTKIAKRSADNTLDRLEFTIADHRLRGGLKVGEAVEAAYYDLGMKSEDVLDMVMKSSRTDFDPTKAARKDVAKHILEEFSTRSTKHEGKIGKAWQATKDTMTPYVMPFEDAVRKVSPSLANAIHKSEAEQHATIGRWLTSTDVVRGKLRALDDATSQQINKHLLNGERKAASKLAARSGIAQDEFKVMFDAYDEMGSALSKHYNIDLQKGYAHRAVRDWEKVAQLENHSADDVMRIARELAHGAEPTPKHLQEALQKWMKQFKGKGMRTGKQLKSRKIQELDDAMVGAYYRPEDAFELYVHQAAEDIAKGDVFKALGYKNNLSKYGKELAAGGRVSKNLDTVLKNTFAENPEDLIKVKNMLIDRYVHGTQAPNKILSRGKNVLYASLLGNPFSAMTQFGDLIFPMYKFGMLETLNTWQRGVRGMAKKSDRLIKKERLGMYDAVQELSSAKSKTKSLLDWSLKIGGFTTVDRLGKETLINTAYRHWKKVAATNPSKFKAKWSRIFGKETEQVMRDLQDKKVTDNVAMLLTSELLDVQPVALSQMPQKYLAHPKGRVLYMLRSYTIKQLNFMRKMYTAPQSAYQRGKNLAKFAALFMAANISVDTAKDFLNGKDFRPEHQALDNLFQMVGFSAYSAGEVTSKGLGTAVTNFLAPPLTVFDFTREDTAEDVAKGAFYTVPIVGRIAKAVDGWQE